MKSIQSPYSSNWNLKILENYYDVKYSDKGNSEIGAKPIFKLRKISQTPLKQTKMIELPPENTKRRLIHSHQHTAEITQKKAGVIVLKQSF